ncbi:MAG: nucleoside hydrolase [Kiritimatiellae bacterium]|nr:nucleoside hydrolase [Kiritimatiellia bacterium]
MKLILDTDMLTDCDDLAAMGILHTLADYGEVDILATVVSSKHPKSAAVVDVVNTFYGRPNLPIGAPKGGSGVYMGHSVFLEPVSAEFPHTIMSNDDAEDAVVLYRKILAAAQDNSIVIATIGYMSNLELLLKSTPDEHSSLDGLKLIEKKVKHWVCMGGNFPIDSAADNVNFTRDGAAAVYTIRNWPGKIIFVGREIGHKIFIGEKLRHESHDNPIRRAYQLHRDKAGAADWNHHTADPCTIIFAVRGLGEYWTMSKAGNIDIQDDCSFVWREDSSGNQTHVIQKMDRGELGDIMEALLVRR